MTEEAHSLFSASGAEGWMYCYAKPLMERGRRTSSTYANEGTAAHTLADWVLTRRLAGESVRAEAYIGRIIAVKRDENSPEAQTKFTVDADMAEHVNTYVDDFLRMTEAKKSVRYAERRLHYNEALGVDRKYAFGTGDGVVLLFDQPAITWRDVEFPAGNEIQIHDLKYGQGVRVFADGPQMKHYGLGVLQDFEFVADYTRIRMVIHQPRLDHIDEHVMTVADLRAWAALPRNAAEVVLSIIGVPEFQAPKGGWKRVEDVPERIVQYLQPTDKGCRFCDAKTICPKLIGQVQDAVSGGRADKADFRRVLVDTPADVRDYGDNWLTVFADRLELIADLTKAVKAEIDRRVLRGGEVKGFKVIQGAQGDRVWSDKDKAETALKTLRLEEGALYTKKLITPPQAEKLLKKSSPATWQTLQPLIYRAPGGPVVVRDTDPRPAYSGHKAAASDFKPVRAAEGTAAPSDHPFR